MTEEKILYVVEQHLHCQPRLETWNLIEERKSVWIVSRRWGSDRKTLRKDASFRHYFTDEIRAATYLRKVYHEDYISALRRSLRMAAVLRGSDGEVMAYARGDSNAALKIDQQVNGEKE